MSLSVQRMEVGGHRACITLGDAEKQVLDYIKQHVPEANAAPLCGNSIATDRGFLNRDMPLLDEHLHYRMIDVSSLKELAKRWFPRVYQSQPPKGLAHRALADIRESVQELEFYRRTLFVADTNMTELPEAHELVEIACEAARTVRLFGYTPKVAFMSYSTFGNPPGYRGERIREAVAMMDARPDIDFEYEGDMPPDLALDPWLRANYPFMRLTGEANVLIMPAVHSASISTKLVQVLGGATVLGPLVLGLNKSVQICPLSASVSQILNMATFAAYEAPLGAASASATAGG